MCLGVSKSGGSIYHTYTRICIVGPDDVMTVFSLRLLVTYCTVLGASTDVDMRENSCLERNGESSRSGCMGCTLLGYEHPLRRTSVLHSFDGRPLFTIIVIGLFMFFYFALSW